MNIADKSFKKSSVKLLGSNRATLTLPSETYRLIDKLRGDEARSAWVTKLIEREDTNRKRTELAATLQRQYTPEVCLKTLQMNDEFPIHES